MVNPLRGVVPDWLIVGTLALIGIGVAAFVGFGIQQLVFYGGAEPTATATAHPKRSVEPTTPTPTEHAKRKVRRTLVVSVFNATQITGLAARTLDQAAAFGWPRGVSGNWSGQVSATTVFYPVGGEAQAKLLASDLGISSVAPSYPPMNPDRLVVVIAGPQ